MYINQPLLFFSGRYLNNESTGLWLVLKDIRIS